MEYLDDSDVNISSKRERRKRNTQFPFHYLRRWPGLEGPGCGDYSA